MTEVTLVKRAALASVLFLFVSACAPMPVPTETLVTPTWTPQPATATPASTQTMTTTPTAVEIPTIENLSVPTDTPLATTTTPVAYDHNPRALLIEADVLGGSPAPPSDMHVPIWRLYGDGTVVFAGARAPLSSGLDAVVRVGHLSESEIQSLFAYLSQVGFFALQNSYQPRPAPVDAPTAHITIFLNTPALAGGAREVKTVSVFAPDSESTPQAFSDAMNRITQTIPADAQTFVPTDAYLESTDAGPVSALGAQDASGDWSISSVRLADAINGVTVSGSAYTRVSTLFASNLPVTLYREGNRAYRVRFAPNVPRAVHLSDWVGVILDAPREFDGRIFEITGYFRGWNLYGEAGGRPPVTRSDWVIADNTGAIYVTGAAPPGLDPSSRADAWSVIRLTGRVVYVRLGTSHLQVRSVQVLSRSAPTPTSTSTVVLTPGATITSTRAVMPTIGVTATRTVAPSLTMTPTRTVTVVP